MNWMLPESASTFGPEIDLLYYVILWITGIVFFGTELTLIYFLIRYRHKEGRKAEFVHGNTKAEVVWTLVPFVIVMGIGVGSKGVWDRIRDPNLFPTNSLELEVRPKQFEWNITYPGPDGVLGNADDFVTRNRLTIPVDRPVTTTLVAEDVIHSFFIPEFRVKQDAVPGMRTPVWFQATKEGEFTLACAELCGLGHYRMRGRVTVLSQTEFDAWMATQSAAAATGQ